MNVGVYGLGNISHRVIKGIQFAKNADLYAVCSRSQEKADEFKEQYNASVAYSDYEQMLQDENMDMIYICTPNYLHRTHIMQALQYEKHVMCEKPMCVNQDDLNACFDLANQKHCFLMEAHKTVFTPLNLKLFEMIQEGCIGDVKSIDAQYATRLEKEISTWHFEKPGAGCMYDIGVYPIVYANRMANSLIQNVKRIQNEALIEYENGCVAHIATSWDVNMQNTAYIYGTKGMIVCKNFWKNTRALVNGEEIVVDQQSDFTGEIEHACTCISKGLIESPIMSRNASLEILKVVE